MWLGEWPCGGFDGMSSALQPEIDRFARDGLRALEIRQRHVAGAEKAAVDGTEIRHHAVVGLRGRIGEFRVRRRRARNCRGTRS